MVRRRKSREAPIETLFKAPWSISVAFGVVVLVVLKWTIPSAFAANVMLKPLAEALSGFSWIAAGVFFFVGLMSFARQQLSASKSNTPVAPWNARAPTLSAKESQTIGGRQSRPGKDAAQHRAEHDQDRVWDAWAASSARAASVARPTEWTIELLRDLEWKRFEDVCQMFYLAKGIKSETTPLGPDGGIDIRLYQDASGQVTSIVQCKAWGARNVGVKPVRELLGVMAHEKVEKSLFMASGNFTDEAKAFARSHRITLVDGDMLVAMIRRLPDAAQHALLGFATEGDFTTPTCPSCGIKMRRIAGSNGRPDFWGCHHYPRCKQKLGVRGATVGAQDSA